MAVTNISCELLACIVQAVCSTCCRVGRAASPMRQARCTSDSPPPRIKQKTCAAAAAVPPVACTAAGVSLLHSVACCKAVKRLGVQLQRTLATERGRGVAERQALQAALDDREKQVSMLLIVACNSCVRNREVCAWQGCSRTHALPVAHRRADL